MEVLFSGFSLFCLAFLLHLITWKIRKPKNQKAVLLKIFFGTLIIGILVLSDNLPFVDFFELSTSLNLPEIFHISLLFISLTFSYLFLYQVLEGDSPTLAMIKNISKAGSEGIDKYPLERLMMIKLSSRIKSLISDGMICLKKERYLLTPKGASFLRLVLLYRKVMNINDETG